MNRILIQFDGSNFYNRVKNLTKEVHLTNFNYSGLAKEITRTQDLEITYYVGEVRKRLNDLKSEVLYANQQSLFSHLRSQGIKIKMGYLLLHPDGHFHEKGVDVQIAVDMVKSSLNDEYDSFYLISSDTDLLPAIEVVREKGKKVVYVGFENFKSQALSRNCSQTLTLSKEQLLKFSKEPFNNVTI